MFPLIEISLCALSAHSLNRSKVRPQGQFVPKFLMPCDRLQRSFNRRDFLCLGTGAAAAPIFPGVLAPAASSPVFEIKPLRGVDFILQNSPTRKKFLIETMP